MRLSKEEKQELLIAKLRREQIAKKTQAQKVQSSGALQSQWAGLMSLNRMIRCNHMMKSNHQLELDYLKDKAKKIKSDNDPRREKITVIVKKV
jgi:hypothetical protein